MLLPMHLTGICCVCSSTSCRGHKRLEALYIPAIQLMPSLSPLHSTHIACSLYIGVKNLVEKGYKKISPFFIPYAITNMGGALLAIDTGFMGPNYSISTACATANYAFVSAANHIRNGDADLMVVGGSEAPIIPVGLGGFVACRALSTRNDAPQKASR